jgi:hypothetical protein
MNSLYGGQNDTANINYKNLPIPADLLFGSTNNP